jgi:hypothetical protein
MKNNGKKKSRNKAAIIGIAAVFLAAILALVFLAVNKDAGNGNDSTQNGGKTGFELGDFYSKENCTCLEHNKPACLVDGFVYNAARKLCVNSANKTVTYAVLQCSVYDCSGANYTFNNDSGKWDAK